MQINSKHIGRAVWVLIAVSLAFALSELVSRFEGRSFTLDGGYLLASVLVLACGYVALALTLARVLRRESNQHHALLPLLELSFRGQLARYLPGKVGVPAVRLAAAHRFAVSPAFMAGTVVMETFASMTTACLLVGLLAAGPWAPQLLSRIHLTGWSTALVLLVLLSSVLLVLVDVRRYPRRFAQLLRVQGRAGPLLSPAWLLGTGLNWICVAGSSALLVLGFTEGVEAAMLAAAAGVLGPIAGVLAVVAPGGLGVREAFVVSVMSPQIGADDALAFGLISRAVMLATELVLWLAVRIALGLRRAHAASDSPRV